MNRRFVVGLVLAAVVGGLVTTAAASAYAQSTAQQSNGHGGSMMSGSSYRCGGMMCKAGTGGCGMGQSQWMPDMMDQNRTGCW